MCIFSQPVLSVGGTQIFARLTSDGTQFLVYEMNYESAESNAMILPLPVPKPAKANDLRFINLENYADFFSDLNSGFPYIPPQIQIGCSAVDTSAAGAALSVFEVGQYVASFVPSRADFARLDPRFTLPLDTWATVPQYADFGFAVFQLAPGAKKPHPMAFEFARGGKIPNPQSSKRGREMQDIYFPTLHIHDGEVHEQEQFDHVLYSQHAGLDSKVYRYVNYDVPDAATGLVRSQFCAHEFCDVSRTHGIVAGDLLVHRKTIRGSQKNEDTVVQASGNPTLPSLNLRPLYRYSPWLAVGAFVMWFLARRSKLKDRKSG